MSVNAEIKVDRSLVKRNWLLVATVDDNGAVKAELHESYSGVPGEVIESIEIDFEQKDCDFLADVEIFNVTDDIVVFNGKKPVRQRGVGDNFSIISIADNFQRLTMRMHFVKEGESRLKFSVINLKTDRLFDSVDPRISVRGPH